MEKYMYDKHTFVDTTIFYNFICLSLSIFLRYRYPDWSGSGPRKARTTRIRFVSHRKHCTKSSTFFFKFKVLVSLSRCQFNGLKPSGENIRGVSQSQYSINFTTLFFSQTLRLELRMLYWVGIPMNSTLSQFRTATTPTHSPARFLKNLDEYWKFHFFPAIARLTWI